MLFQLPDHTDSEKGWSVKLGQISYWQVRPGPFRSAIYLSKWPPLHPASRNTLNYSCFSSFFFLCFFFKKTCGVLTLYVKEWGKKMQPLPSFQIRKGCCRLGKEIACAHCVPSNLYTTCRGRCLEGKEWEQMPRVAQQEGEYTLGFVKCVSAVRETPVAILCGKRSPTYFQKPWGLEKEDLGASLTKWRP